jgi:hypothetical protein
LPSTAKVGADGKQYEEYEKGELAKEDDKNIKKKAKIMQDLADKQIKERHDLEMQLIDEKAEAEKKWQAEEFNQKKKEIEFLAKYKAEMEKQASEKIELRKSTGFD